VKRAGALGRENVGMSNRKSGERPDRRKPKVSSAMAIIGGLGAPNNNPAQFVHKLLGFCKCKNQKSKCKINELKNFFKIFQ